MTEFAKPEDHRQSTASSSPAMTSDSNGGAHHVNGLSNGHCGVAEGTNGGGTTNGSEKPHKSSSSSSGHKSSSSSHHKSSSKDKHRDKDRSSSSHKSSSSSSHKSSHKDKSRDKERSSSSSGHKSSSSDKHKSSSGDKEREHKKDRDKERHKSSSSSSGHKSSSSSSKEKTSSTSSSSSSSSKDKERHHHHSSSKSSHKDKHRDKERSRDKEQRRDERKKADPLALPPPEPLPATESIANGHQQQDVVNGSLANVSLNRSAYENDSYLPDVKLERMDISQASSCDYSLSQFRDDEQSFGIKAEPQSAAEEEQDDDDEDVPLFKRKRVEVKQEQQAVKREDDDDDDEDDEDVPLTARKKVKAEKKKDKDKEKKKKIKREAAESDYEEEEEAPKKKKVKKEKPQQTKAQLKEEPVSPVKGGRKKKGDEQEEEVWKWWEEEKRDDGVKWTTLEHRGPVFAPEYEPLPKSVRFEYDGRPVELSQDAEEIATFYARMLDHEYTSKKVFNDNFFKDWRKAMTAKERDLIKDLSKCNFRMMADYFAAQSEANKNRSKEEKQRIKEQNEALVKEYGYCIIDGHREKIGNFKIEPPGLFRGRGEHPKMGHLKKRVVAEDIIINCSKGSVVPKPPPGHKWKEVRHDNTVTWLASWVENVQGQGKYIMLNPSSRLKGEKDWAKYETARRLDKTIDKIRATYREEWKSKEMRIRQRAVALYFIDKLALRAGNEKDEDQADTVGCCSLRVEHIELHRELNGKENVVVFDFLGKDSIRYYNEVEVEKRVFKNLELFKENKKPGDDLFDRLNTVVMNEHLRELMDGLTAKVFRTYNASITLQRQLDELTEPNATVAEKLLQYNRANRAVAILCNHQRAVPKTHGKSMENLKEKIRLKREQIKDCEAELKALRKEAKRGSTKERLAADKKEKQLERLQEQLQKLEIQETDKDENKTIALGTSKLNYLDPRISVAWCKKFKVPIEKIFNKTQRDKFRWAIDMAGPDYRF